MLKILDKVVNITVVLGGWSILAASLLVTYDVVTRKVFNLSIAGADEISGYIFAVSTACAFSYALLSRANIRIDLLYNWMPEKIRAVFDILSIAMTAGFFGIICYYAYNLASDSIVYESRSITPLQIPLAIPQVAWFAALILALLTSLILLFVALKALLKGDTEKVGALVGIPSVNEEIELELEDDALSSLGTKE